MTYTKQQAEILKSLSLSRKLDLGTFRQLKEAFPDLFPDSPMDAAIDYKGACNWAQEHGLKVVHMAQGDQLVFDALSLEDYVAHTAFAKLLFISTLFNGDAAPGSPIYSVGLNAKKQLYISRSTETISLIPFYTELGATRSLQQHKPLWQTFFRL